MELARASIAEANLKTAQKYNKGRRAIVYNKGDRVLLSTAELALPGFHPGKLKPKFLGPFTIVKVVGPNAVKLSLPGSVRVHPVVNVERIQPADQLMPTGTMPRRTRESKGGRSDQSYPAYLILAILAILDGRNPVYFYLTAWQIDKDRQLNLYKAATYQDRSSVRRLQVFYDLCSDANDNVVIERSNNRLVVDSTKVYPGNPWIQREWRSVITPKMIATTYEEMNAHDHRARAYSASGGPEPQDESDEEESPAADQVSCVFDTNLAGPSGVVQDSNLVFTITTGAPPPIYKSVVTTGVPAGTSTPTVDSLGLIREKLEAKRQFLQYKSDVKACYKMLDMNQPLFGSPSTGSSSSLPTMDSADWHRAFQAYLGK